MDRTQMVHIGAEVMAMTGLIVWVNKQIGSLITRMDNFEKSVEADLTKTWESLAVMQRQLEILASRDPRFNDRIPNKHLIKIGSPSDHPKGIETHLDHPIKIGSPSDGPKDDDASEIKHGIRVANSSINQETTSPDLYQDRPEEIEHRLIMKPGNSKVDVKSQGIHNVNSSINRETSSPDLYQKVPGTKQNGITKTVPIVKENNATPRTEIESQTEAAELPDAAVLDDLLKDELATINKRENGKLPKESEAIELVFDGIPQKSRVVKEKKTQKKIKKSQ